MDVTARAFLLQPFHQNQYASVSSCVLFACGFPEGSHCQAPLKRALTQLMSTLLVSMRQEGAYESAHRVDSHTWILWRRALIFHDPSHGTSDIFSLDKQEEDNFHSLICDVGCLRCIVLDLAHADIIAVRQKRGCDADCHSSALGIARTSIARSSDPKRPGTASAFECE